jgi:hypothetical protein
MVPGRKKASTSFLKRRSKKPFHAVASLPRNAEQRTKVFWFFFSKKNILPSLACPAATPNVHHERGRPEKVTHAAQSRVA